MKYLSKISDEFYSYYDERTKTKYTFQRGSIGVLSAGKAWRLRADDKLVACFMFSTDGYEYEKNCYGGKLWTTSEALAEADKMVERAIQAQTKNGEEFGEQEFMDYMRDTYSTAMGEPITRNLISNILDYAQGIYPSEQQYKFLCQMFPQVPERIIRSINL